MFTTVVIILVALSPFVIKCGSAEKIKSNIKLVTMTHCEQPSTKWDPASAIHTEISIKKLSRDIIKINATVNVTKAFGPVELHSRTYQVRPNSVRDLVYKIEHADCRSFLSNSINSVIKFQYDTKCFLKAGVYVLREFDLNSIKPMFSISFAWKGRYSYEFEITHAGGAAMCILFVCDVTI